MTPDAASTRPGPAVGLAKLIEGLSQPSAYPHHSGPVTVIQTHISVVFLAGEFAYKVKKPLNLGFLDFSTHELRRWYCHEEVRLNRRLAPDVYLGVVPICRNGNGFEVGDPAEPPCGGGEPVEWAVRMRRLPDDRRMSEWVEEGSLRAYHVAVLARRLAAFHARADRGPEVSAGGGLEIVGGNARDNLLQSRPHIGITLSERLHERLTTLIETTLERLGPLIERRARDGVPRDTHGDLHLDHIYLFGDRGAPNDIVIVDCIEFSTRFRHADPIADMAFVDMDLRFHHRPDLADVFDDAYLDAADDPEGAALLRFYSAYRAHVRAKVLGIQACEPEVEEHERDRARQLASAHWVLSVGLLEVPERRPCLLLVGGLPGTGKSTLARAIADRAGFHAISSDRTRKRLAGIPATRSAQADYGQGIYAGDWTDRTYGAMLEEARRRLSDGERVIIDASFHQEARRRDFLSVARELRVPARFLQLAAPREQLLGRISGRSGGASDADAAIHDRMAKAWEPVSGDQTAITRPVDTSQSESWSVEQALQIVSEMGAFRGAAP